MPRQTPRINGAGSARIGSNHLLAALAISALIHLLILEAGLLTPPEIPEPGSSLRRTLTIRTTFSEPDAAPPPIDEHLVERAPTSASPPAETIASTEDLSEPPDETASAPERAKARPMQAPPEDQASRRTAIELLESAPDVINGIFQQKEQADLESEFPTVFDPGLRKRLRAARQEEQRRKAFAETMADHPLKPEITGHYGDYVAVRIGDRCWRVPVDIGDDPFNTKLWMMDPNCARKSELKLTP